MGWYVRDVFFLMIRRPPRSTQGRSSAASDVYKRQIHARTKPVILELPLLAPTWLILFTDGILEAGQHNGAGFALADWVSTRLEQGFASPAALADALLAEAMARDQGRPHDDMSVLVLGLLSRTSVDPARRLAMRFPMPPF